MELQTLDGYSSKKKATPVKEWLFVLFNMSYPNKVAPATNESNAEITTARTVT